MVSLLRGVTLDFAAAQGFLPADINASAAAVVPDKSYSPGYVKFGQALPPKAATIPTTQEARSTFFDPANPSRRLAYVPDSPRIAPSLITLPAQETITKQAVRPAPRPASIGAPVAIAAAVSPHRADTATPGASRAAVGPVSIPKTLGGGLGAAKVAPIQAPGNRAAGGTSAPDPLQAELRPVNSGISSMAGLVDYSRKLSASTGLPRELLYIFGFMAVIVLVK